MTVGIGRDDPEKLANALFETIIQSRANLILFFVSKDSFCMIDLVKTIYLKKKNKELKNYKPICVDKIDDFDYCFELFSSAIIKLDQLGYEVLISFNSGTKTMCVTSALVGALYDKQLMFLDAKRGEDNFFTGGTESLRPLNLYRYRDTLIVPKVKYLFNNNRFDAAKALIDQVSYDAMNKDLFKDIFDGYYYFDNVQFNKAFDKLKNLYELNSREYGEFQKQLNQNIDALKDIVNKENDRCYYILASILNNARRRFDENKFDDAIARLYRSLELVAQIQLYNKYGIITENVDIDILRRDKINSKFINRVKKRKFKRIALKEDYELLLYYGDELGKLYYKNKDEMMELSNYRNDSILAHGLVSLDDKKFDKLNKKVFEFARVLKPDIDYYIKKTEFPKFMD
ncbi:TIGR02710 family CRISPR-associated CARF protein [uncultured Methanobrevibacter sp.]|uniref:TIGR02710 family CRISPR-associated CARF protein n=1 Tax=uncultured Methanobrevibacter sp. TaxID=253161 RepID=UPI0025F4E4F7|nr:TIGR02710 family CRISPR-associated CARF protein [uncultured Methanobrevibacter sp.]